jgi:serine/threonine-protein kinase
MSSAARVKAGEVLGGKYRVERVLGQGGMGMVVAARHVQLGQRVALKFMLKEAMTEPAHAERFAREARSAVQLQSAHTARVLDVGKLKNGEPYMVMEYLEGHDLDAELRKQGRALSVPAAVDYMLQACEAFAEAHSLGMIHRDIKPKNLYLTRTVDGRPLVKVLDFGLAKTIGQMGDVSLTATSAVFGSPQYMSPEQMRSAKDVDTRSDIWSIGVCLYELLTTRVPFDAPGLAEICAMVLKDPLVPPTRYNPDIPPELEAVIVKCLSKEPNERYQTVAELAFALEPWSEQEGSAKRILHVMQTVQKTDVPTIVRGLDAPADTLIDAQVAADGPKTVDGWDSGEQRTRKTTKLTPAVAALGVFGLLAVVGAVLGTVAVINRGSAKSTASASAVSADSAEPPLPAQNDAPPASATIAAANTVAPTPPAPPTTTANAPRAGAGAPPPPPPATTQKPPPKAPAQPPKTAPPPPKTVTPAKPPPPKTPNGAEKF